MSEITQVNLKVNEGSITTVYIPLMLATNMAISMAELLELKAIKVLEEVDKELALYNDWKFEQLV